MKSSKLIKTAALTLGLTGVTLASKAQLTMSNNQTAQQLVDMLVGPGVVTSNAVLNCPGITSGKFSGVSNLGIDSGIILSTGQIVSGGNVIGVNAAASQFMTTNNSNATDPDLEVLSTNPSLYDACYLEFDFIPKGDTVRFQYVFGSEEYPEYACSNVNDIFALLISGPGIVSNTPIPTKRNVALVPGTNTPIMINTIAPGPGIFGTLSNCQAVDPNAPYAQYFVDNTGGTTVVFDGFTSVMTAEAVVIPCEQYKLKFAIANVGDGSFDSGIFLKAGSLTSTNVQSEPISGEGANTNRLHTVRGCKPAEIDYRRTDCDTMQPFTFHLDIGGDAVPGVHYETIPNTLNVPAGTSTAQITVRGLLGPATGEKFVTINVKHPDSVLVGAAIVPIIQRDTIWIYDSLYVNISSLPRTVCPNTPIEIAAQTAPGLDFSWTPAQYNNGNLTINPNMITSRSFTITVRQLGAPATCPPNSRTYHGVVEQYPVINMSSDTTICVIDSVAIPVMVSPDTVNYRYTWTPANYLRAGDIGTNYFSAPPGVYNYNLVVSTPEANCTKDQNIQITAVLPEQFTGFSPENGTIVNYNEEVELKAFGNFVYYTWFPSDLFVNPFYDRAFTTVTEAMNYKVIGIDKYGCTDTGYVFVNVKYPHDPIMPNAFSPNGDGKNDIFKIPDGQYNRIQRFDIFDRWGQLVFSTQDNKRGWDGTYKMTAKPCEQGAYMYIISLELPDKTIKTYKGDITLIR